MAYSAALESTCASLKDNTTCKANKNCTWDSWYKVCELGSIDTGAWVQSALVCSGSPIYYSIECDKLANKSSCEANKNCQYLTEAQLSAASFASLSTSISLFFGGEDVSVDMKSPNVTADASSCVPKWFTDATFVKSLESSVSGTTATTYTGVAAIFGPIFDTMFGKCDSIKRFKEALLGCSGLTTNTTCKAKDYCSWSSLTKKCDVDMEGLFEYVLYDTSDSWVAAINNATDKCDAMNNYTACVGAGTITTDTAKLASYATISPGAAGVVRISSMLLGFMASVGFLWAFLLL